MPYESDGSGGLSYATTDCSYYSAESLFCQENRHGFPRSGFSSWHSNVFVALNRDLLFKLQYYPLILRFHGINDEFVRRASRLAGVFGGARGCKRRFHFFLSAEFGDVDEALQAAVQINHRAERVQLVNCARNLLPRFVQLARAEPRIGLERFERKENLVVLDFENFHFNLVADFHQFFGVVHDPVRKFGDVDHAFDVGVVHEADEDAEIGYAGNRSVNDLPDRVLREKIFQVRAIDLALGENDFVRTGIEVDDLRGEFLADEFFELLG